MNAVRARSPSFTALFRMHLIYLWRHHRRLRLAEPQLFTELVQWRKLYDQDARMPLLADKLAVKEHVADRLGREWVVPTLWSGEELPEAPPCAAPFVVKARHGCNQTRFAFDGAADWPSIRADSERWMKHRYGFWLDEWLYRDIPRGLLIEPFIGEGRALPVDYKFYVFGGHVAFIQVHLGRGSHHRWMQFDRDWRRVSAATDDPDPPRPQSLAAMIAAAETLGRDQEFIRTDFYQRDGKPIFGEITFYPGSGLDRFDPVALDEEIGAEWRKVRATPVEQHTVAAPAIPDLVLAR